MWASADRYSESTDQSNPTKESGMVSIVVTMIMILVISLIVIGFAQVSRNNQRAALDRQLSAQAFYAAETGINDAKGYIRENPNTASTTNCNDFITTLGSATPSRNNELASDGSIAYTCLTVNNSPKTLRFQSIGTTRSTVTPLFSPVAIPSLVFSWQANSVGSGVSGNCSTGQNLPAAVGGASPWDCAYGLLRLDLMQETGATGAAGLAAVTRSFYFKPSNGGSGIINVNSFSALSQKGSLVPVQCNSTNRTCQATINLSGAASTTRYYARLSSVYKDSQNVIISSTGPNVRFAGSQVVLDSTGRAQDVLRRLQVRVSTLTNTSISTAGISSTGEICKLISVVDPDSLSTCPGTPPGSLP